METFFKHQMPSRIDKRIERDQREAAQLKKWNAEIDARDLRQCRCCGKRSDPDVMGLTTRGHRAHIVYASAGGSNEPRNRMTLCATCHNAEHRDRLRFTADGGPYVGLDANGAMEFWNKDAAGVWFLTKREIAPHVVEKD